MMTLYFSPGACSLASHIGLEETGAPYEIKPILLAKGQQRTETYLKINPRGKVPALSVGEEKGVGSLFTFASDDRGNALLFQAQVASSC